jgi:hypothetical protein
VGRYLVTGVAGGRVFFRCWSIKEGRGVSRLKSFDLGGRSLQFCYLIKRTYELETELSSGQGSEGVAGLGADAG